MRFLEKVCDGGNNSGVTSYTLIEIKKLFSISILVFKPNHRENFHNHAFHALTWWLAGEATETMLDGSEITWKPSWKPKFTSRNHAHKYQTNKQAVAFTIRGSWLNQWNEFNSREKLTLTHGRKVVSVETR